MKTARQFAAGFAAVLACALLAHPAGAVTITVDQDVMTSPFFTGTNLVRGYPGDNRNVHRVSTTDPFGTVGAETIYMTFDYDFSSFTTPVRAILTVQSASGGFGADAGAGNPFTVSAHGVSADPLASITDDTNPGGPVSWLEFFADYILAADSAAFTTIDAFGPVTFDVSALVNAWISGTNTVHALALTGKNDVSGNEFLHGFLNNSQNPGATFLTVTPVPEPETWAALLAGLGFLGQHLMRRRRAGGNADRTADRAAAAGSFAR